jgi:ssDNA-specific exonuclease RecJ
MATNSTKMEKINIEGKEIFVQREKPGFTQEDIGMQLGMLIAGPDTPKDLKLMVVAQDAPPAFELNEAANMDLIIQTFLEHFNTFKQAFVVTSPKNTAFTMAYKNKVKDPRFEVEVFYTEKAALDWLSK